MRRRRRKVVAWQRWRWWQPFRFPLFRKQYKVAGYLVSIYLTSIHTLASLLSGFSGLELNIRKTLRKIILTIHSEFNFLEFPVVAEYLLQVS